jgi:hypothetical protein
MPDVKVSDLIALASPSEDDLIPIVEIATGETKKITFLSLIASLFQRIIYPGIAKPSNGNIELGFPDTQFSAQGTEPRVANTIDYFPMLLKHSITITDLFFELSSAAVSAGNVRFGIYRANAYMQPIGAPLFDSGDFAVAQSAIGVKTISGLSVNLTPGRYVVASASSVSLNFRAALSPNFFINKTMGTSMFIQRFTQTKNYGAFETDPVGWETKNTSSGGFQYSVFFQWTE